MKESWCTMDRGLAKCNWKYRFTGGQGTAGNVKMSSSPETHSWRPDQSVFRYLQNFPRNTLTEAWPDHLGILTRISSFVCQERLPSNFQMLILLLLSGIKLINSILSSISEDGEIMCLYCLVLPSYRFFLYRCDKFAFAFSPLPQASDLIALIRVIWKILRGQRKMDNILFAVLGRLKASDFSHLASKWCHQTRLVWGCGGGKTMRDITRKVEISMQPKTSEAR